MLKQQLTFTLEDGRTLAVPEYVVELYCASRDGLVGNTGLCTVRNVKWLRVTMNLGLKDAVDLHRALVEHTRY